MLKKGEKFYGRIVCIEEPPVGGKRITFEFFADREYWDNIHLGAGIYFSLKR